MNATSIAINFEQIRQLIKEDPEFLAQLRSIPDQETWVKSVIQFSKKKGVDITTEEVTKEISIRLEQIVTAGRLSPIGEVLGHSPKSSNTI